MVSYDVKNKNISSHFSSFNLLYYNSHKNKIIPYYSHTIVYITLTITISLTLSFCRKCSPFLFTGHSTINPIANQMKYKKMQYINKLGFSGYIA